MRILLYFSFFFLVTLDCFSQVKLTIDPVTNKVAIAEVKDVNLNRQELYDKINYWIVERFTDPSNVVIFEGPELIVIKYTDEYILTGGEYKFTNIMKIKLKDNKYKVSVSDIESKRYGEIEKFVVTKDKAFKRDEAAKNTINDVQKKVNEVIDSLGDFLSKKMEDF